jgi:hypothetical protein
MLETWFEGLLNKREEYGYSDSLSIKDKFKILTERLVGIKEQLVERQLGLPFEVEPRRRQSRIPFSPCLSTDVTTTAKEDLKTPTSSTSMFSRRMHPSDLFREATEPAKRHKLDVNFCHSNDTLTSFCHDTRLYLFIFYFSLI